MADTKPTGRGSTAVAHAPLLVYASTAQIDDLLNEKLQAAIDRESGSHCPDSIARIAAEHAPIDLAYAAARLPQNARALVYHSLPSLESKIDFILHTDSSTRSIVYRHLSDEELGRLASKMTPDDALRALENLSEWRFRRVLEWMGIEEAEAIAKLQRHERRSAGRLMTQEFLGFRPDATIGQVQDTIRDHPGLDLSSRVFVINAEGGLEGHIPTRYLIISRPDLIIRQVMQPVQHRVAPETSREEVVDLVERYKIPVLPVVEEGLRLIGVVTEEEVIETLKDIADETIAQMAGTLENLHAQEPIYKRVFARAPWLLVTLCGGLVNALLIAYFEQTVAPWLAFLLFFIPLITGMSGNVGVQCSTVLVRGMALGLLSPGARREAIAKELRIGVVTGVAFGLLCGGVIFCLHILGVHQLGSSALVTSVIVSAGLCGACFVATLLGVFSPLVFARIGVDPAVSSGPIVTACNDVLAMLMYFLIAQGLSVLFFA